LTIRELDLLFEQSEPKPGFERRATRETGASKSLILLREVGQAAILVVRGAAKCDKIGAGSGITSGGEQLAVALAKQVG
jgi:hypothetical protein